MIHRSVKDLNLGHIQPHLSICLMYPSTSQNHSHTHMGRLHIIYPHPPNKVVMVLNKVPWSPPRTHSWVFSKPISSSQPRYVALSIDPMLSKQGAIPPCSEATNKPIPTTGTGHSAVIKEEWDDFLNRLNSDTLNYLQKKSNMSSLACDTEHFEAIFHWSILLIVKL